MRGFGGGRFTLSSTHEVTCPSPACFGSGLLSSSSSCPWAAPIASVCFSSQLRPSPGPPWPAGAPQLCTSVPASPGSGLSFQFPCAGLGPARISPSLFVTVHTVTWERGQREIWARHGSVLGIPSQGWHEPTQGGGREPQPEPTPIPVSQKPCLGQNPHSPIVLRVQEHPAQRTVNTWDLDPRNRALTGT